jgi:hypothetical protein
MTQKEKEHTFTVELELTEEVLAYYEKLAEAIGDGKVTVESLMEGVLKLEAMGVVGNA